MTVWGPGAPKYGRGGRPVSKRRKRTVSSVKKSCDRLWSEVIRSKGVCERCGGGADNAHHAYGRKNHRLRFELRNGVSLCYACHRWVHDEPISFAVWFYEHRPEDAEWLAEENRNGLIKRNLQDYLDLETQLKTRLDKGE